MAWLRRTFVRGILLILPLMITLIILGWLFELVTGLSVGPGINCRNNDRRRSNVGSFFYR